MKEMVKGFYSQVVRPKETPSLAMVGQSKTKNRHQPADDRQGRHWVFRSDPLSCNLKGNHSFKLIKLISFQRRELEINYFLLAYISIRR